MLKLTRIFAAPILTILSMHSLADSLQERVRDCAAIKEDTARLQCYDAIGGNLDKQAERNFGQEQQRAIEEAIDSLTAKVEVVQKGAYGKLTITLDNGQVWRQNDSTRILLKPGNTIELKRAALGSFMMRDLERNRSFRVKRVR